MAFDGVTIANVVSELKKELIGGRLYKIAQPEADELLLTIKQPSGQKRLLISAEASLPLIYLTESNKPSPMTAPNFCMLLRKHLANGRITDISQPGLERIVHIGIEHLDEMGDLRRKTLVVEIMGKHSNIIFCNDDGTIIDSIKHVSAAVSSSGRCCRASPISWPRPRTSWTPWPRTTMDSGKPWQPGPSRLSRPSTAALPASPRAGPGAVPGSRRGRGFPHGRADGSRL